MDTGSGIKVGGFRDSELQLVVLQEMTVSVSVKAQLSVGYEYIHTSTCTLRSLT